MKDAYLIYKNLTRKKLRLFLTLLSILVAFLIYGAVMSLKVAMDSGVDMAGDNRLVVINKINFTQPLPVAYVNKIKAVKGVRDVTWANWFGGYYQDPARQVVSFAADPESYLKVYSELEVASGSAEAWIADRQGALVGESLARSMGWKVGDRIPLSSNIFSNKNGGHTWELVVDGIFRGRDKNVDTTYLLLHYKYFIETQTFGGDWVGWIVLTTDDPALNETVAKTIDAMFANSAFETETSTEKAFNKAFVAQIGNISLILYSVIFTAFFTILMVVGNSIALSVRERFVEIAVLKALGFTSGRVFAQILAESLTLACVGGGLGLLMAHGMLDAVSDEVGRFIPNLELAPGVVHQGLIIMLIFGVLTGLLPALAAYRLSIARAFTRG
jgi:putative ABC transport system permease protein